MDALTETILSLCSLTKTQITALLAQKRIKDHKISLNEALKEGRSKPVAPGTYYRIVRQARNRLRKSINDVVVGVLMGVIEKDHLLRLLQLLETRDQTLDPSTIELIERIIDVMIR